MKEDVRAEVVLAARGCNVCGTVGASFCSSCLARRRIIIYCARCKRRSERSFDHGFASVFERRFQIKLKPGGTTVRFERCDACSVGGEEGLPHQVFDVP